MTKVAHDGKEVSNIPRFTGAMLSSVLADGILSSSCSTFMRTTGRACESAIRKLQGLKILETETRIQNMQSSF